MALDREKLKARLRAVFAGELAEHVSALNRDLLVLEKAQGEELAQLVQLLFRTVHTLKGAARSVSATPIERLCHELESAFGQLRARPARPSPAQMQTFFAVADALEAAGRAWAAGGVVPAAQHGALLARLQVRDDRVIDTGPAVDGPVIEAVDRPGAASGAVGPEARPAQVAPDGPDGAAPGETARPPHGDDPDHAGAVGPVAVALVPRADDPDNAVPPAPRSDDPDNAAPPVTAAPRAAHPDNAVAVPPAPRPDNPELVAAAPRVEPRASETRGAEAAPRVRVAAELLEALMRHSGELLVTRRQTRTADELLSPLEDRLHALRDAAARLAQSAAHDRRGTGPAELCEQVELMSRDLERARARIREDRGAQDQVAGRLEDAVRVACLQPFAEAAAGLERIVRDLAHEQGKDVALEVAGTGVALDRAVLNRLKPALLHLVRNAVDHGIEPRAERAAAGKPAGARVRIEAHLRGGQVDVTVSDDGRGIERAQVLARARAMGLAVPADAAAHLRLVFHPGLSTAARVSEISGRGVGLDVVNGELEALHGRLELRSEPGRGTTFRLSLPVSLSTFRVLVVEAAGRAFGLVTSSVERVLRVSPRDLTVVQDRPMLMRADGSLQVAQLAGVLGLTSRAAPPERQPLVIVAAGDDRCAIAVDALVAELEIVLKPLGPRLAGVPGVAGAAMLPDGRVCLVLTAADLVRQARAADARGAALPATDAPPRHLIVADDSVTTRLLLRGVLEEAGYLVTEAADGQAALELLEARGADLVVSDVEMPRMDGLTLTRAIRRSSRFRGLPVVLVTSLESDPERLAGLEAGATAYLKKSAFEQDALLETLAQLL